MKNSAYSQLEAKSIKYMAAYFIY